MSVLQSTATQLLAELNSGNLSSVDLAQSYLDQIESNDESIGAFLNVDAERVLTQAKAIDNRRQAGESLGLLDGLPVAVKDVLCTKG